MSGLFDQLASKVTDQVTDQVTDKVMESDAGKNAVAAAVGEFLSGRTGGAAATVTSSAQQVEQVGPGEPKRGVASAASPGRRTPEEPQTPIRSDRAMANRWFAKKAGEMAEDAIGKFLGIDDKDKDKDESFFSKVFNRDDDDDDGKKTEDDKKDGFFSNVFDRDDDEEKKRKMREREMERKKNDEKDGFFSKFFDKDDDKGEEKKSGFSGLFSELEGVDVSGEDEAAGRPGGQTVGVNDGDLLNDLMEVAEETSKE